MRSPSIQRMRPGWLPVCFWALLLFATGYAIFSNDDMPPDRYLEITLTASQPGALQVYYDLGSGFSEQDSGTIRFGPGAGTYSILLPNGEIRALRLDPGRAVQRMQLENVAIKGSPDGKPVAQSLSGLSALNEIASIQPGAAGVTVTTAAEAEDAQLLLPVNDRSQQRTPDRIGQACRMLLLLALIVWVVRLLANWPIASRVPDLLLIALLLASTLAITSTATRSVHPDEYFHVAAADYYLGHWVPPAVDAPAIVDSYSAYGASYLNELDVVYLIAAKTTRLWSEFHFSETIALRLFNVLLFGGLLATVWMQPNVAPGALVLLLTPQIWYVFSYFNADAFALFLALVMTMLFAPPQSPVARFVDGEPTHRWALCAFTLAFGLLLVSKRNYLPVVFAMGLSLSVRHLGLAIAPVLLCAIGAALLMFRVVAGNQLVNMFPATASWFAPVGLALLGTFLAAVALRVFREPQLRPRLYRLGFLAAMAVLVALPRIGADLVANGGPAQKSARMSATAEHLAYPRFKPSTLRANPSESYFGLGLAAKGVTFSQLMSPPYSWAKISWTSMLGVYGYMTIFGPIQLYWLSGLGFLILGFGIAVWAFGHFEVRRDLVVVVTGVSLVVLSSIAQSWANDLQAQGRYLLPAFAIVAGYFLRFPGMLQTRWASVGTAMCFIASILSFVGVAIPAFAHS